MRKILSVLLILSSLAFNQAKAQDILGNSDVKMVLDSKTPLWKISLLGPQGETPVFEPMFSVFNGQSVSPDGSVATLSWTINLDRKAAYDVEVSVNMDGDLPKWHISAELPQGWIVTNLEFPRVNVHREEGVKAIIPMGYGAEFEIPRASGIEARYPSVTGGMEFVLSHNAQGCHYFAADDKAGCGKYFVVSGDGDCIQFVQRIPTSYAWTDANGHFELPWGTTFAYNEDSWDATLLKWYRPFALSTRWGEKKLTDRTIVEWVQNADVWVRPKNMFPEVIDGIRKAVAYYGEGLGIHWYHWHHHAYDTWYPEYFPPKDGFKEMVQEVQAAGAHVTPYINGRLWDPANIWYQTRNGASASCRKQDGTLYTEIYPTSNVVNTVTCPASDVWQEILLENPDRLIHEVGTHGVYIDQIGAAASEPCYATNHGHAPGAGSWWPEAYKKALDKLRTDVFESDRAITTEENAECYLDLFDMYLIVNTPHSPSVKMVPVFPLIYSDRVVYSGLNYYHQELHDGHFLYNNGRSLLWGAQLGWIQPDWLFAQGCEREVRFLKTLGNFRSVNHDVFYGGRFLSEVELGGDIDEFTVFEGEVYPEVMAALWETVSGKKAIIAVNMGGKETKAVLPCGKEFVIKPYSALRINL